MARMYNFPNDFELPVCDICGSGPILRRTLVADAKGTQMNLVECVVCGLRFFSPRPKWEVIGPLVAEENEQAQRLFDTGSFLPVDNIDNQKAAIRSYYLGMLHNAETVLGHVPNAMFEVGGNVGWFGVAAKSLGIAVIDGCDLNPHATKLAREGHGLTGFEAGDFAYYVPRRQYDLVVALDYLEHTYTPRADLHKLAGMIAPGGVFLAKTFVDELDTDREMLAPPTHAIHWTTKTLRAAIEQTGLRIKQWLPGYKGWMPEIIAQKA